MIFGDDDSDDASSSDSSGPLSVDADNTENTLSQARTLLTMKKKASQLQALTDEDLGMVLRNQKRDRQVMCKLCLRSSHDHLFAIGFLCNDCMSQVEQQLGTVSPEELVKLFDKDVHVKHFRQLTAPFTSIWLKRRGTTHSPFPRTLCFLACQSARKW